MVVAGTCLRVIRDAASVAPLDAAADDWAAALPDRCEGTVLMTGGAGFAMVDFHSHGRFWVKRSAKGELLELGPVGIPCRSCVRCGGKGHRSMKGPGGFGRFHLPCGQCNPRSRPSTPALLLPSDPSGTPLAAAKASAPAGGLIQPLSRSPSGSALSPGSSPLSRAAMGSLSRSSSCQPASPRQRPRPPNVPLSLARTFSSPSPLDPIGTLRSRPARRPGEPEVVSPPPKRPPWRPKDPFAELNAPAEKGLWAARAAAQKLSWIAKVEKNGMALKTAPDGLRWDRDLVLAAVKSHGGALEHIMETCKNGDPTARAQIIRTDREIIVTAVKNFGEAVEFASAHLRDDKEILLKAVGNSGPALRFASKSLQNDREVALLAVAKDGLALQHALTLKDDFEVALCAVQRNGLALQHAGEGLQADKNIVLAAVASRGDGLQFASEALRSDKEVVLAALRRDLDALKYASEALKNDWDILALLKPTWIERVSRDPECLKLAPERLRGDKDVALAAVRRNAFSLLFAPPSMQGNKQVVLTAIDCGGHGIPAFVLNIIPEALRNDKDIIRAAVMRGVPLTDIPEKFQKDRDIMIAARAFAVNS